MNYANDFGKDKLEKVFKTFETKYGERFKVDESL
jgi:3-hydroxyacyl-CoA dehydrogenase/enoyl-CoA hydratase/3-hydroxybutyryl-CoA epimerase